MNTAVITEVCSSSYELIVKFQQQRGHVTHARIVRLAHNRILVIDEGKWDGEKFHTSGVRDLIQLETNSEIQAVFSNGGWNMAEVECLFEPMFTDEDTEPFGVSLNTRQEDEARR